MLSHLRLLLEAASQLCVQPNGDVKCLVDFMHTATAIVLDSLSSLQAACYRGNDNCFYSSTYKHREGFFLIQVQLDT